jgi:hypothetical protein
VEILVFILGAAIVVAGIVAAKQRVERDDMRYMPQSRRTRSLGDRLSVVARHLPQGRMTRTGHVQSVTGRIYGRDVTICSRNERVEYHLEAPGIRVSDVTIRSKHGAFDVHAPGDSEQATLAATTITVRAKAALGALLEDQGLEAIFISEGQVMALGPGERLAPTRAKRVFRDLSFLAQAAEEVSREMQSRAARSAPTSDKPIDWSARTCPFCRDSLAEGARVACERCQTVHHGECFAELGRCTTTGCKGTEGVPVTQTHERAKVVIGAGPCNECGLRGQGCTASDCRGTAWEQGLHKLHGRRRTRRTGA